MTSKVAPAYFAEAIDLVRPLGDSLAAESDPRPPRACRVRRRRSRHDAVNYRGRHGASPTPSATDFESRQCRFRTARCTVLSGRSDRGDNPAARTARPKPRLTQDVMLQSQRAAYLRPCRGVPRRRTVQRERRPTRRSRPPADLGRLLRPALHTRPSLSRALAAGMLPLAQPSAANAAWQGIAAQPEPRHSTAPTSPRPLWRVAN